jgi:protease-4
MQVPLKIVSSIRRYNLIEIELQGEILEEEERFFIPFFPRKRKLTLWDLEKIFFHASASPGVLGVLIKIRGLKIGLARAEAIRRGILELREKGKRVFVYIESAGNTEYLIGSAGDSIFTPPWLLLNLIGLKAEVTFFKDMLDKLEIEAQVRGLGEYKTAAEIFTRKSMSEPHRAMIDSIIDDLYNHFVKCVSQGRRIKEENLKSLIDSGPFIAEEALEKKLIDELLYESDLEKRIEEILGEKIQKIRGESFLRIINVKEAIRSVKEKIKGNAKIIALLFDSGMIILGESKGGGGVKTIGSQTLIGMLKKVEEDKNIKALVLRISSPGGSGIASDLIRHRLKAISEKKPVVLSMSDVVASGGYLISLGARKIVAEAFTLTGSIGIIWGKFNLRNFLNKIGVTKDWIVRGNRAMMFSSYKEFTKDEEEKLGEVMGSFYEDFVRKVAEARGMDFKNAERLARGRVWTGKQAKELGLVDELGGIREAINIAKKEAGIPEDVLPVIKFFSKPKVIQFTPFGKSFSWGVEFIESLESLERDRVLALMPFWIEVR